MITQYVTQSNNEKIIPLILLCLFNMLMLNIPVNNCSVMAGHFPFTEISKKRLARVSVESRTSDPLISNITYFGDPPNFITSISDHQGLLPVKTQTCMLSYNKE